MKRSATEPVRYPPWVAAEGAAVLEQSQVAEGNAGEDHGGVALAVAFGSAVEVRVRTPTNFGTTSRHRDKSTGSQTVSLSL